MQPIRIELLDGSNFDAWFAMRRDFWEDDETFAREAFDVYRRRHAEGTAITFIAFEGGGRHLGFLDAELRTDYVQGAERAPVWYVEGVYVVPGRRGKGIGRILIGRLEDHVRATGCSEVASSCPVDNVDSEAFHKAMGFHEDLRTINFIKRLD